MVDYGSCSPHKIFINKANSLFRSLTGLYPQARSLSMPLCLMHVKSVLSPLSSILIISLGIPSQMKDLLSGQSVKIQGQSE